MPSSNAIQKFKFRALSLVKAQSAITRKVIKGQLCVIGICVHLTSHLANNIFTYKHSIGYHKISF